MDELMTSPSDAIAGNLSRKHGLAPKDDQDPGDHHGPWQEDATKSSKLVEMQAATFNRNPRSPSPSPALDRPIYQWTENTLSLRAKPALPRSMSFPQKDEATLEAWLSKTDDFVSFLQGPGTRLLNLIGPPFSGKSTAAPAILRRISANTPFVFIYVAKTQLDVETLSRECAPVWKRCGTSAIHVVTYEGLQEKLLCDGLPGFSVVFFDEDSEASVSYVMAWLSLCICAAKQTHETRLRIVAISEGEASPWQRASLTNLGKVSTEQMEFMKAPFRSMLDPEAYITNHLDAPTPIARRSFLNNFVDTSQPAEKRVLLFYGDHATLAWWLKGMNPKTGRPPVQVLRIGDTSSTTINRFINRVARARQGDRLAVCIQPGFHISFEQASKFQFTHVLVYGRYTQGVVFSRVTGSFVNSQDASKPASWEVLRTLTLGSSYEVLPATSVFCPSAPFARRDETQLYRQKDLPAFILSCVDLAQRHSISFSHLMEAFSDDLEPDIGVEMLRRLGLAGLVDSPGPGEFHPSQSMRARAVCEWLPLTRNSAAAARLMAGLKLYENNIPLQRTIIAMAVVFAYSDKPFFKLKDECLLSPSDISSRLTSFFYKEGEPAAIPLHHGYLWYALEIFRWAINIGDVGKLNKGGKLCLAQVLEVDEGILGRMYAHYLCIAAKVGHGNGSQDGALNLSPINSSDASSLHDELHYCSLDQLYWIDDMGNPEWPPPPRVRGPQSTIMDLVSQREVKAGQDCRLLVLGELAGPRRGVYAVSISPIVCGVKSSFHVPNLTHIPPETMERWHTMRIEHDSHIVFHRGRSSKKIFPSRYPCVRK